MLFKENLGRLALRTVAGLIAAAALASCGGGTYQIKKFSPGRVLTFGDESNSLVPTQSGQGLKYSINGISANTDQIDCSVSPLWTQVLAASYNMVYAQCNSQAVAAPTALDMSTLNATVDDTSAQVDAFGYGNFAKNDLVTIWVGVHDVLADYQGGASTDPTAQAALVTDMTARGQALAQLVNRIAAAGAKVILVTIPDLGYSPFAYNETQQNGDFDRAALLSRMSEAFNNALRVTIVNDGSEIGLVLADNIVRSDVINPGSFGLIDSPNATAGCLATAVLPNCDDNSLVTDTGKNSDAPGIYLWADDRHLGPTAQAQIGNEAVSRVHSNPF